MDIKRFNNPEYKKQIKAVRNYRRPSKPNPETKYGKAIEMVGLGERKNQLFLFVILAVVVYLFYFAEFLMVRSINVEGAPPEVAAEVNQNFLDYSKSYRGFLLPQKNIVLFNKSDFRDYLLKNNFKIAEVINIKAKLWHDLSVTVKARVPKYTLESAGTRFILNSDGTVGGMMPLEQISTYTLIKDTAEEEILPNDKFFNEEKLGFLESVSEDISQKLFLEIEAYEVPGKASDQLVVVMKKGFRVYFSTTSNEKEYFQRFSSLWLQLTPEQQNQLAYFDLRFEKNAYSCFKNSPCVQ